jgi:hypothetical protein
MGGSLSVRETVSWRSCAVLLLTVSACSSAAPRDGRGTQATPILETAGASIVASGGVGATATLPQVMASQAGHASSIPIAGTPSQPPLGGVAGTSAVTAPPSAAGSGSTTPPGPAAMAGPALGTGTTCLKPGNGMYNNPGPYKVAMTEVDLGMIEASQHTGKFTIYYPDPLETSCLHPIVAWGNGTGVKGSGTYAFLNSNAASWGVVVAESQEDNTGSGNFHKAGIDYLIKQNGDPSSMFYKKLSTRAGVSGHSQGGFGASAGSAHPAVVTAAIEGATMIASAKVSVLILTGTKDIVMNAESLVTGAKGPMFVADWEGGDHVTTETIAGSLSGDKGTLQFTRLYAAWLRCTLADDPVACKMFSGGAPANCGICKDMGWHGLASNNL